NTFASDQEIQDRLLAFTRTNSRALYGNLLTLPVGDGLLYVQPLYTLRESGEGRYPVLRYVLVSFGDDVGIGPTLTAALDDVLGITSPVDSVIPGESTPPDNTGPDTGGGQVSGDVRSLLEQAEEKFQEAEQALQDGDLAGYAAASEAARELVEQALAAAGEDTGGGNGEGGDGGGSGNGSGGGSSDEEGPPANG
ncbi:MAG TPA: UPF0182 family protein, partial [Nocardioidaceae bacterium]|nr:UPF0182 family protein [Nocardioidaceae bacterium]